jgi:hypothetical protein
MSRRAGRNVPPSGRECSCGCVEGRPWEGFEVSSDAVIESTSRNTAAGPLVPLSVAPVRDPRAPPIRRYERPLAERRPLARPHPSHLVERALMPARVGESAGAPGGSSRGEGIRSCRPADVRDMNACEPEADRAGPNGWSSAPVRLFAARHGISARSAVHLRPLDTTSPPARRYISARSAVHLRPVDATSPPGRPGGVPNAGLREHRGHDFF